MSLNNEKELSQEKELKKINKRKSDNGFSLLVIFILGLMVVTTFIFLASYRLALVGQEEVAVPNLINKELPEALQDLQAKGLTSQVLLRFSDNTYEAGRIIDQEPKAGFVLRSGRKVNLTVSRGVMQGVVPNFIGQNIEEARNYISFLYANTRPLMIISNPMRVYDDSPVGTILSQDPMAGTEISSLVEIKFRVSQGKVSEKQIPIPSYLGLSYTQAIQNLFENRIPFSFSFNNSLEGEDGVILSQSPEEGSYLGSGLVQLTIKAPKTDKGYLFTLLDATLPVYPVFVKLDIILEEAKGTKQTLYSFYTKGNRIAIPAVVKEGSSVSFVVFGKEAYKISF